jgi:hypothetical protein
MMVETSKTEPNSSSAGSELEFEDEEKKSPNRIIKIEEIKSSTTEEESSSLNSSCESSQYSTRVIEFDDDDKLISKKVSKKNLQLEMVNLREQRELKEFKPEGTVN